ncbi:MAG: endonuclease [Defluviitaleaceae bacterium]|nr:endonuclease [Defluviitaleaceae bacterium]
MKLIDLHALYNLLYAAYGNLNWWPASSHYEMMIGAVLTQNTNWLNVEKAIANLPQPITPQYIEKAELDELKEHIRPAGFFNQKSVYLKTLTAWYKNYNYDATTVQQHPLNTIRKQLLSLKGIGSETADCIVLYAFGFPSFVIDAYTRRLLTRVYSGADLPPTYEGLKALFESQLPADAALFNNYHACIVMHAKDYCRAKPVCEKCPLAKNCSTATQSTPSTLSPIG